VNFTGWILLASEYHAVHSFLYGDGWWGVGEVVAHCVVCSYLVSIHDAFKLMPKVSAFYMPMLASINFTPFFLSLLYMIGLTDQSDFLFIASSTRH
jgi:hypothetical protein